MPNMKYQLTYEEADRIVNKFNPILSGTMITKAPFKGYSIITVIPIQDFEDNFQVNLLLRKKINEENKECCICLYDYLNSTTDYFSLECSQK